MSFDKLIERMVSTMKYFHTINFIISDGVGIFVVSGAIETPDGIKATVVPVKINIDELDLELSKKYRSLTDMVTIQKEFSGKE